MTSIELFPWLFALCVTLLSAAFLRRFGVPNVWALSTGLVLGIVSWLSYVFGGKRLLSWLEQKKTERENAEKDRRVYQAFDPAKEYPASKNLFYECPVCGNAIPSLPKKSVGCKCRNILINASSGRIEIRDRAKVKLFSLNPP